MTTRDEEGTSVWLTHNWRESVIQDEAEREQEPDHHTLLVFLRVLSSSFQQRKARKGYMEGGVLISLECLKRGTGNRTD